MHIRRNPAYRQIDEFKAQIGYHQLLETLLHMIIQRTIRIKEHSGNDKEQGHMKTIDQRGQSITNR